MDRILRILAWVGAVVSALVIWQIVAYIRASDSNHTAFEPWLLVVVFAPTIVFGILSIRRHRAFAAGLLAITLGVAGLVTLTYIDRTNTMLQYERWLSRGMPVPHR